MSFRGKHSDENLVVLAYCPLVISYKISTRNSFEMTILLINFHYVT